ncbi:MAG TPA: hypothetical protein VGQ37_00605 [Vicinamibacterales bacterium]|nr:hypothetical protein [Vicinamibacterales bacterium]
MTALLAQAFPLAQDEPFSFIISVLDQSGRPVRDLERNEIVVSENGVEAEIEKVEPFTMPVALTIAVDNGPLSADALAHYRTGLTALVRALPADMEVTLITMSPQPMMVVKPTTDRIRLLRGVNGFAPQEESPRFTDTLVEFSRRYETALKETNRIASLPILLMVSTTVTEAVSYSPEQITRALQFLERRKAKVHVVMLNLRRGASPGAAIDDGRQTMIAIPATKVTNGRFETLANSSRLTTLLPEMGTEIAALHRRLVNQLFVTARRQSGRRGPLQNGQIGVTRKGLTGSVSLDGLP